MSERYIFDVRYSDAEGFRNKTLTCEYPGSLSERDAYNRVKSMHPNASSIVMRRDKALTLPAWDDPKCNPHHKANSTARRDVVRAIARKKKGQMILPF